MNRDLKEFMKFRKDGKEICPLKIFSVNDIFILGIYQGSLSEFDILIKYRQKDIEGNWSRIRTPKHIHWAVDILIKMYNDKEGIVKFLDFLLGIWDNTAPVKNKAEREKALDIRNLLEIDKDKVEQYKSLSSHGEYKVGFLILLAKLLMIQEKTNREDAYMFKKLLEKLKEGKDIFSIVSVASHTGR